MNVHMAQALAYDDTGGPGDLVVLLPGAGDLRSEYRFLVDRLVDAGHRVVSADLPGHGDSPPAPRYTVESTADALVDLVRQLDTGPATVIGTSFPPAAAVWAAAEHPELFTGLVAISPHLTDEVSWFLRTTTKGLLSGPWAGRVWAKLYSGWYKAAPPADLEVEIGRMKAMLAEPARRRAVRETLTADRTGVDQRITRLRLPSLTVFGSHDDHFGDPAAEAKSVAERLNGEYLMIDGAGHYPHVEQPGQVADAIVAFLDRLR